MTYHIGPMEVPVPTFPTVVANVQNASKKEGITRRMEEEIQKASATPTIPRPPTRLIICRGVGNVGFEVSFLTRGSAMDEILYSDLITKNTINSFSVKQKAQTNFGTQIL